MAQKSMHLEESLYKILFEQSGQGMAVRQEHQIILANQSFAEMLGYPLDEIIGLSGEESLKIIHPEDREKVVKAYSELLEEKHSHYSHVYRFLKKNGEIGWWSVTVSEVEYQGQLAILGVYEDITESKVARESLERSRAMLASTLNVLPVGVCLTDEQGYYRMMNDSYCAIYEYEKDEMLGQHYSVIMPPDQIELANKHYARMLGGDVGIPVERKRQRKDGSIVYIEAANALVIGENGKQMIITTVRDITERRRSEEIIRLRLRLLEYANTHSLPEIMQKALDEICDLTNSTIGFYHFVDEDQNTISLQAWSTRTLNEFCQAEGEGLHYPVAKAGIWADSIRLKKPVIHNDYASISDRKGLPEGHAEVVRELVVPTIREGKVIAILGVGNKPKRYLEPETELVAYIADLVWAIVERKRKDEQIRELNIRLEQLAMIDDLTQLPNRRSFFAQGEKETLRAKRYETPFSLLMMDLDNFKQINDTFGHVTGDQALQRFSQILKDNIRSVDIPARMGGEEFSVLMPETELVDALNFAERIRIALAKEGFEYKGKKIPLTVSIGVAECRQGLKSLDAIINQADSCLYQAKEKGRNQVFYIEKDR